MQLWKKHLGTLVDETTTGVQKTGIPTGVDVAKPLSAGSISGIKKVAQSNFSAYEEVFLHTPRNGFRTLTEGRETAYPILSSKDNTRDFSKPPRLRSNFMKQDKHDVATAIAYLRANISGFWTTMPLDWGYAQGTTPAAPAKLGQSIAKNETTVRENETV
jgi:phospholipase D1/2